MVARLNSPVRPFLLQVFPLRGERRLFLRINARGVQAVAEAELVIEDERHARADAFPLFFERRRGFVFGPRLEVCGGEVFEVVRAASELALVMAAVIQIEHVIASLVEERRDIADPVVVSGRESSIECRARCWASSPVSFRA